MPTANLLQLDQFEKDDGTPLASGKVYTYTAGTSTPLAAYTDNTANTALANPIILDSDTS